MMIKKDELDMLRKNKEEIKKAYKSSTNIKR